MDTNKFLGETLAVNHEDSQHDRYTVVVYLNDRIVGHLPWSISQVSCIWFFMVSTKDECMRGLKYMLRVLFEGRHLFVNPSETPWLIFEAGIYLEGAFIQGNTVHYYSLYSVLCLVSHIFSDPYTVKSPL